MINSILNYLYSILFTFDNFLMLFMYTFVIFFVYKKQQLMCYFCNSYVG